MNSTQMLLKRILGVSQLIFTVLVLFLTAFAAGEADPTFNTNAGRFAAESVNALALQPDGKILVGGSFTSANGQPRIGIARFNADGSLDASFNAGDVGVVFCSPQSCSAAPVNVIALQADGKIIIGGEFFAINGTPRPRIARLNPDGSLDTSFRLSGTVNGTINAITVQPDGKVLVGGNFSFQTVVQGTTITRTNLIRLNSDGSYDSTFGFNAPGNVADIILQPDGKIIIGGGFGSVARLNSDGTLDTTFANLTVGNGAVNSLVLQPDGKVIAVGSFTSVAGVQQNYITRLNSNGTIDATFNAGGLGPSQPIKDVGLVSDGRIIIVGDFASYNTELRFKTARLNADGSLDTSFSFNPAGLFFPTDVIIQPDGEIVVSGTHGNLQPGSIFRSNQNGLPDTGFSASVALSTPANVYDLSLQSDGKILVGGDFTTVNGLRRTLFARVNADGSVDTNFVPNLDIGNVGAVYASAQQADGKVLVGGRLGADLQRLNADGSRDTTFSVPIFPTSEIYALAVLPDGKILAGGAIYSGSGSPLNFVRLNSNGSIDASFSVTVNGEVRDIFLQPDGKILIGGNFTGVNGAARNRIARLNADGTLDLSFNPPLGANNTVYAVAQQTDGKILIAGIFTSVNQIERRYVARFNTDGSLDNSFNSLSALDAPVYALAVQPDGRILIGGSFTAVNSSDLSSRRLRYARLLSNGVADPTFNPDPTFNSGAGANDIVQDVLLLPSGAVLIGGHFTQVGGQTHVGLARVINSFPARTAFDFDGDGRADISVFRPSNGFWYRINSATNTFSAVQFGQAGDHIAPADYDGDGKTDIAVFRPGSFGYFYILNSADNSFRSAQFGTTGDVPMSGEWDGDGKADLAVYRGLIGSSGQSKFYYRPSAQPNVDYQQIDLGAAGDKPVYGDWNGNGMLDAVVFRPSNANFYFRFFEMALGISTDVPILADFDGNGRASIAVFRPSNGTWYTSQNPQTNFGAIQYGANGDLLVPADYDGDGQTDLAVFRPSNGGWYLNRTTSGFTAVQFGAPEDKPIPNAYIR